MLFVLADVFWNETLLVIIVAAVAGVGIYYTNRQQGPLPLWKWLVFLILLLLIILIGFRILS